MSFHKITRNNVEFFTLKTHPQKTFISGSGTGVTGSIPLFSNHSSTEFYVRQNTAADPNAPHNEQHTSRVPHPDIRANASAAPADWIDAYGDAKKRKVDTKVNIKRDAPNVTVIGPAANSQVDNKNENIWQAESSMTASYNSMMRKNVITNVLTPFYRTVSPNYHFAYTNYHCLNFFTASCVSPNSALLYPCTGSGGGTIDKSAFTVNNAFTFEFWINPRYDFVTDGTVLHMSSNYAVSLVTGSKKFFDGSVSHYGLKLQLSSSAEIAPSSSVVQKGVFPHNFVYTANDVLERNRWHHVAIAWELKKNDGTGSFYVDGAERATFHLTNSIGGTSKIREAEAIVIGNFYATSGSNTGLKYYFNNVSNVNEGVANLVGNFVDPKVSKFTHPLNAEVHEIRVFNKKRSIEEIREFAYKSLPKEYLFNTGASGLLLYVPPFFTKETAVRDVKFTPHTAYKDSTSEPFNIELSFRVDGYEINLENYVRDFATGRFPRLLQLTGVRNTTSDRIDVARLLDEPFYRKRNLTILPNDNGLFSPNFKNLSAERLYTGSQAEKDKYIRFRNDLNTDLSSISLRNLVSTHSLLIPSITNTSGTKKDETKETTVDSPFFKLVGVTPEEPNGAIGTIRAVAQRTQDVSSNEICWFDISNMFYDKEIKPQSFVAYDTAVTSSDGKVKLTLKDDGYGNIFRADAITPQATWNSVGNIFYPEGIVLLKSPHLSNFGKDRFEVGFSGSHNVHTQRVYVKVPRGMVNSSSHNEYIDRKSDNRVVEHKTNKTIISSINLYNQDFNIVGKCNLAQAFEKADQDSIVFILQQDY